MLLIANPDITITSRSLSRAIKEDALEIKAGVVGIRVGVTEIQAGITDIQLNQKGALY
jgi:hypothetical protein